jgi:DNA-nicking Smr family endonuclease
VFNDASDRRASSESGGLIVGKRRKIPVVQPDAVRTLHGTIPAATVDLHGLTGDQGERRVRDFVEMWRSRKPGAVLRIVTGKGLRSEGAPVLRERVRELLTGPLAGQVDDFVLETGGGSYLVRVR